MTELAPRAILQIVYQIGCHQLPFAAMGSFELAPVDPG
jgi:hypothetical protein